VGHGCGTALLERQPRLGPVERLDLGLLVDAEYEALLHKSADGRSAPYPGQTYPAAFVTGMPSAV
jgi:hypothetical protein